MKKGFKNLLFYLVFIGIIIMVVVFIMQSATVSTSKLNSYSDLLRLLDDVNAFKQQEANGVKPSGTQTGATTDAATDKPEEDTSHVFGQSKGDYRITSIYVSNSNVVTVKVENTKNEKDTTTYTYTLRSADLFHADVGKQLLTLVLADGSQVELEYQPADKNSVWLAYLPYLLIIVVFVVLYIIAMRKMANGGDGGRINSFGKARVTPPQRAKDTVRFKDVAGADEEKEELKEIVDFLKDPAQFTRLGAKIPHGVLLVGPPGTGKTLLAKAVAGEAGVPFFSISGSDFVEMYVGVGASRVRDLFETARKAPASIIFIDEIDAVGRHRGAGLGGGHDEREQTLNQLLVEMDGFGSHDGVIVMAATNRPDILDPALLRPGRFDRKITVNVPDLRGREDILKVHARNKPLEPDVNLREVARSTAGFTGADLANLLNEAALLAARRKKSLIGMADIEDAFIKVIAGPQKKSRPMKEREKRNTAYHESGHAMIAYLLGLDPVQQISIIPSGNALGYTLNPPAEDKYSVYKNELKNKISMLLGGRAAEALIFGDVSGGASNDIKRATDIAKQMVTQLGMSDILGPRCFGTGQEEVFLGRDFSSQQDYSDETAAKIDIEIHEIIREAYNKAISLLQEHIEKLHFLADYLVKHEIMDGDQFRTVMEKDAPTVEEIEEIAAAKKRRSSDANNNAASAAESDKESVQDGLPDPDDKDDFTLGELDDVEDEDDTQSEDNK